MATTRVTDIVLPQTFASVVEATLTENSRIRQSGIAVTDPRFAVEKGFQMTVPFWRRPAGGEADSQGTDETVNGVASKLTQGSMNARVLSRAKGIAALNIASYASGADAVAFAAQEFARIRVADEESALVSMLKGITAANVANNVASGAPAGAASDMVKTLSITTGTIAAANKWSKDVLVAGRASLGDKGGDLKAIIMHSDVANNLRAQEPNAFIPFSLSNLTLDRYMGYIVIESDNVGIDTTVPSYPVYTSYMLGDGIFAYDDGPQDHPLEDYRNPLGGNFSGVDTLIHRWRYMLHPYGWQNNGTPANGVSLTNTELATAANWARAVERKAVPLTVIKTNG